MALEQRLQALAVAIGDDIQDLRGRTGTLSGLNTTAKTSLVAAVNELLVMIGNIEAPGGGAVISDGTTSTTTTWSSTRIGQQVTNAIAALVGSAPAALDTLQEIAAELADQDSATASLVTAVGNRIRFDAAQTLTAPQQLQACQNIGVGNPEIDLVAAYTAARNT